jgi:hypothetical protein
MSSLDPPLKAALSSHLLFPGKQLGYPVVDDGFLPVSKQAMEL